MALAACILHQPQLLLLLDEPTAGVDPQARRDFWKEWRRLAFQGLTILVSTHYMDEVELFDEVIYISHGKIIIQGTVRSILNDSGLATMEDAFIYYMNKNT